MIIRPRCAEARLEFATTYKMSTARLGYRTWAGGDDTAGQTAEIVNFLSAAAERGHLLVLGVPTKTEYPVLCMPGRVGRYGKPHTRAGMVLDSANGRLVSWI